MGIYLGKLIVGLTLYLLYGIIQLLQTQFLLQEDHKTQEQVVELISIIVGTL